MPPRLAYVMGGRVSPDTLAAVKAGTYPRFEYNVFLERNPADLITLDDTTGSHLVLARWSARHHLGFLGLATVTLDRARRYDAILTTGEDVGLPMAILSRLKGVRAPVYIISHGSFLGSRKFRVLMKLLRRMSGVHFLCLSSSLTGTLIEEFGVPARRVHAAGYGVDTRFFQPEPDRDKPPLIVSAGTANRDYLTLLRAIESLDVKAHIAADSAWYPTRTDLAHASPPPNVTVASAGNYEGLRDLYARASFVVVPLYPARHACGYAVIAEAMAMGKPVIATETESPSDYIVEGETGFYVRQGDADQLRERITYLLDHPSEARRMGNAARARIESEFSVEAYCARIERAMGLSDSAPAKTPIGAGEHGKQR